MEKVLCNENFSWLDSITSGGNCWAFYAGVVVSARSQTSIDECDVHPSIGVIYLSCRSKQFGLPDSYSAGRLVWRGDGL